jgi:fatty-acid desaturase
MAKLNEKWILMGHNYYVLIISFFYFILLTIDIKLGIMYNVAVLFLWIGYIFINILDHMNFPLGYRNFETNDNSTNNLFTGYIVGEWHNNHHNNPQKWNEKECWWEFDIPAQVIKLIRTQ